MDTFIMEIRHREKVELTESVRNEVKSMFQEMHQYLVQGDIHRRSNGARVAMPVPYSDICLPVLGKESQPEVM